MPNRTVYIRIENVDTWDTLENKSEWLNNALGARGDKPMDATVHMVTIPPEPKKSAPTADAVKKVWPGIGPVTTKLCKHGADPKMCKFASPGKACK